MHVRKKGTRIAAGITAVALAAGGLSVGLLNASATLPGSTFEGHDGNFAVNTKSKHQDEAFELLNWLATPEFGQLVADELNQFSAIPGVEYEDEVMQEAWANAEEGQAPYLLLVDFRYGEPLGTAVLGAEVQKMFLGQVDAAGAATALQTGISQWFTPGE